jgi:sugar lactone lactonase YvrE
MRLALILLGVSVAALALVAAAGGKGGKPKWKDSPATIPLPNGFAPEGIDVAGTTFYVGSRETGAIFRGSLLTGTGTVFITPPAGQRATGLQVDRRGRLFVSGAGTGRAFVYDAATGAQLANYQLTANPSFINDVVVTKRAVWFTDSVNKVLYKLALGPEGQLPAAAQTVPLTGDINYVSGFNANGIDATRNGKTLLIVQTNEGLLFTVDAATGVTRTIDLGGARVRNGDGILLRGKRLYVVQNLDNRISVVKLHGHLTSGEIVRQINDQRFDVPTTIDRFKHWLYAVNARFTTPVTPTTTYTVVRVPAR